MATFMVDSESIVSAGQRVAASSANLRAEVSALMGELVALHSSWNGTASAQFSECITQWQGVQAQVEAALDNIGTQLHRAASVYSDAEAQSAALFAH